MTFLPGAAPAAHQSALDHGNGQPHEDKHPGVVARRVVQPVHGQKGQGEFHGGKHPKVEEITQIRRPHTGQINVPQGPQRVPRSLLVPPRAL